MLGTGSYKQSGTERAEQPFDLERKTSDILAKMNLGTYFQRRAKGKFPERTFETKNDGTN